MKTKHRFCKEFVVAVMVMMAAILIFDFRAFAASQEVMVSIPVKQIAETAGNESFTYEMIALENDAPMPEGAVSGKYKFSLNGTTNCELQMLYDRVGDHTYEIRQIVEDPQDKYVYDQSDYIVQIRIKNETDGLQSEIYVSKKSEGKTAAGIVFENVCESDLDYESDLNKGKTNAVENPAKGSTNTQTNPIKTGDNLDSSLFAGLLLILSLILIFLSKKDREGICKK